MRHLILAVLLMTPGVSWAQQPASAPYPKFEWFVGASTNHFFYGDSPITVFPQNLASLFSNHAEGNGMEGSLTRNVNKYLGIKADASLYFDRKPKGDTATGLDFHVNSTTLYLMAGPEIKARNHTRLTPFAHALLGIATSRSKFLVPSIPFSDSHTRTGFVMALGGGVDIRVSGRFSVRAAIDYSPTFLGAAEPDESGRQNHSRLSLGILFH
jgi:opacity protein-like surface antigen